MIIFKVDSEALGKRWMTQEAVEALRDTDPEFEVISTLNASPWDLLTLNVLDFDGIGYVTL